MLSAPCIILRPVHTMKVIRIVCVVHTECALTAIRIKCTFDQSTSIGGLKANRIITELLRVIYLRVIDSISKRTIREEITSVTLLLT